MVRNFPYQGKPFKLSAVEDASDKHREGVFPGKENRLRICLVPMYPNNSLVKRSLQPYPFLPVSVR